MKVIKPLKQGLVYRTFENDRRFYLVVTVFNFFPFNPAGAVLSEIDMWKFAGAELGKEGVLDSGMPKPRGEVVVFGKFFSPGGVPVPGGKVRVRLAGMDKTLYVFGERYWKQAAGAAFGITDPEPMTVMDVSYANAFGGPGYAQNPLGKGSAPVTTKSGKTLLPLPNVEDPKKMIASPKDRPSEPAGLSPFDMTWPQRFSKSGTYDEKWFNERFPGLPQDLDWTFHNTVPLDQQVDGFFKGDEPFEIEGMHPDKARLSGRLPAVQSRCFVQQQVSGETLFKEVPLRPETVWLFPHGERGIIAFRGTMEVAADDAEDITHLLIAYERMGDEQKSTDHYQEALLKRLDKEKGYLFSFSEKDLIPPGETSGFLEIQGDEQTKLLTGEGLLAENMSRRKEREQEKIRARLKEAGIDPAKVDLTPPPAPKVDLEHLEDLERLVTDAKEQQVKAEEQARKLLAEQGFDYDQLVEDARKKPAARIKFSAEETIAQLKELGIEDPEGEKKLRQAEAMLNKAYREYGQFFPPCPVPGDDEQNRMRSAVVEAHQKGKTLSGRDFAGADFSGLELAGVDFKGAFLEGVNFSQANLEGADLSSAVLVRANLSGARLHSAKMSATGLGEADLCGADVSGADMTRAVLAKADLSGANLSGSTLDEADFSEAKLAGSDMTGVSLKKARFMETDLSGAVLSRAVLDESLFLNGSVEGCDFSGASLKSTIMVGVKGDKSNFSGADLDNFRLLNGASFQGAGFGGARLTRANLRGANLSGTDFQGADISESDFGECDLQNAVFSRAVARQTGFAKANLADAQMGGINLFGGSLQKADLNGTNLQGANLCMVDFMRVKFRNTNVGGANLAKTSIQRWIPR